jgi:four helix bundle protein
MHPFRRLSVWTKAHELTLRVYQVTDGSVHRRHPGLASQLRRAAASIPATLAEGAGQSSPAQFNRCIEIAQASAREADYHLLLAKDLGVLSSKEYAVLEARIDEVEAMLYGLRRRVQERMKRPKRQGDAEG